MGDLRKLLMLFLTTLILSHTKVQGQSGQSACRTGDVRLVDGSQPTEGRVEICFDNAWGTVCDDFWDNSDAGVVCAQLGYSRLGAVSFLQAFFGMGTGPILLDDIQCIGSEEMLVNCSSSRFGEHNCGHSEDAGVRCFRLEDIVDCDPLLPPQNGMVSFNSTTSGSLATYSCDEGFRLTGIETRTCFNGAWSNRDPTCTNCRDRDVRIVNGSLPSEGRVEICSDRIWGTVCDDRWDNLDAGVVCSQLGFSRQGAVAVHRAFFGMGTDPILLDDLGCIGTEETIFNCSANPFGIHNCRHSEDAGVICIRLEDLVDCDPLLPPQNGMVSFGSTVSGSLATYSCDEGFGLLGNETSACFNGTWSSQDPTCTNCRAGDVRLVDGSLPTEGRVEICFNNTWGTICDDAWGSSDAAVVCSQLGFSRQGAIALGQATFGMGIGLILLDNVQCIGSEETLFNCRANPILNHNCAHFEDAGARCIPLLGDLVDCDPLLPPQNGMVSFDTTSSGSLATYLCDEGFILLGSEARTCFNGTWLSTDPTCNSSILLPYGELSAGDEILYFFTTINFNFTFFGRNETTIYVQDNGILSFREYFNNLPEILPLLSFNGLIAPFWTDLYDIGNPVLVRVSRDQELLVHVGSIISGAFFPPFSPSSLFIATWVNIPGPLPNQTNTFQVVLSTDGTRTYAMFLYHSMQWGEANATVGFNFGDRERSFTLSDRFTSSIDRIFIDFDASSNVGIPGAYIFQIDQDEIIQPQDPPVQGVDYIPFLDLDAQDGVEIQLVTPVESFIFASREYFSDPIFVNTGIPIGGAGEVATRLYVLSDGAITFQRGVALFAPQRFPYSNESDIQLVAPFLADHNPQAGGSVRYKVYDMNSLNGMDTVSSFIRNSTTSENFQGNWMLAAEWRDIPMFGGDATITNTYQALVISDGLETFTVFIYNCDLLNWIGQVGSYASIGFSVRGQADDFRNFENSFYSQQSTVGLTACENTLFGVPYTTIVYRVGVASTGEQRARGACLERVARDQNSYNVPQPLVVSRRSQLFLQDCPCTFLQAIRDTNFSPYSSSEDVHSCFVATNFQFSFPTGEKFVYRCCYSRSTGSIVSRDSEGHGSIVSFYQEPVRSITEYLSTDFQRECCIAADLCDLFYQQRLPLSCSSYRPPAFSSCNGDPHFLSLDGALGTFNGWGEYTLSQVGQFILQGRTTAVDPSDPTSATKFSAIAFGPPGTIVEIDLVDDGLQVLLNSVDITDTINGTGDLTPRPVSFEKISENAIRTHFSAGVTIRVSLAFGMLNFVGALPQVLQGIPRGLLGNFNGDTSDDLIYPNGTQIDMNSPDSLVHDFGQSWMINPEDSLFTYPEGMGPADFSFPNHVPSFLDEVLAGASDEVMNECGSDAMCIFDATQTGNLDIGLMTRNLIETDVENRMIVANFPPNITAPSTFMVTMNQQASFNIYVVDTNTDSFSIISGDVVGGSLTRNDADVSLYTFTWTPVEIPENPIVFLATDDMNASSQYIPRIEFCQCMNDGECTLQGILDQTANPIMLSCICDNAYEGEFCQDDVDGCRDMPCFPGVECVDNPAPDVGATCGSCPEGYSENEGKCLDIDECAGELGDLCTEGCVNLPGGYVCNSCSDGFELINDAQCRDYDECAGEGSGNTCEQGCSNYPGGFSCTCFDGYELVNDAQCRAIPVTLSPVQMNNAVVITLSDFTVETFDADQQRLFREETTRGINRYCSDNSDQCPGVQSGVKVLRQVQAIAVILTSIENNDEGGIDLIMYVELSDGMVLNQQALLQAVESNADGYARAGFGLPSVQVLVPTDPPALLSNAIIGIIVAAGAAVAILLIIIIMLVICCCYRYRKTSDKKPEMAPIHMEENPNAINMDDKESTGIAAEYTIKEDLVDGEFCVYNDNTEVDNKM